MRYVESGEIRCSALGFGCGGVMGRVGRTQSLRAMHAAWDAGITLFDTARSYGYGEAEGLLGEFLQGKREQAALVTKFGIWPEKQPRWKREAKPLVRAVLSAVPGMRAAVRRATAIYATPGKFDVATLRASLEASLRNLRSGYVDALLAHEAPASLMAQEDLMAELENVVSEGKARCVGISATGREVIVVAMDGPALLSVLQYPAWEISDRPAGWSDDRFSMANHPFGGGDNARRVAKLLKAMAEDARLDRALREKLRGDPTERLAEYWFARTRSTSRPRAIVASMLSVKHVRANTAAIVSERFSADDLATVGRWITTYRLLR
jgi:hypothetical protein